uniref:Putative secreted protein n=1 Tax=Rhipicephalus microplus TaxID=6941 RepID=A0A6G5A2X9_RHIMP
MFTRKLSVIVHMTLGSCITNCAKARAHGCFELVQGGIYHRAHSAITIVGQALRTTISLPSRSHNLNAPVPCVSLHPTVSTTNCFFLDLNPTMFTERCLFSGFIP